MNDVFQDRYEKHQERKKKFLVNESFGSTDFKIYNEAEQKTFFEILKNRCSQRNFTDEEIDIQPILEAIDLSPSSCGRKGVSVRVITERDKKDLLSGLLVGGTGWINRAKIVLLLIADMNCYKNSAEKDFMPYLDAGVLIQTAYLTGEAMNLGVCYCNPNIRTENQEFFKQRFEIGENQLFCGCLALGKFLLKHTHSFYNYSERNELVKSNQK